MNTCLDHLKKSCIYNETKISLFPVLLEGGTWYLGGNTWVFGLANPPSYQNFLLEPTLLPKICVQNPSSYQSFVLKTHSGTKILFWYPLMYQMSVSNPSMIKFHAFLENKPTHLSTFSKYNTHLPKFLKYSPLIHINENIRVLPGLLLKI